MDHPQACHCWAVGHPPIPREPCNPPHSPPMPPVTSCHRWPTRWPRVCQPKPTTSSSSWAAPSCLYTQAGDAPPCAVHPTHHQTLTNCSFCCLAPFLSFDETSALTLSPTPISCRPETPSCKQKDVKHTQNDMAVSVWWFPGHVGVVENG